MVSVEERFWTKVKKTDACWLWTAQIGTHGYGCFWWLGHYGLAHRWSYEHAFGPIPEGTEIDHLCRVRACVNPAHLEAVPHGENMRRSTPYRATRNRTHCVNGHEITPSSHVIRIQNGREAFRCRVCDNEKSARYHARKSP